VALGILSLPFIALGAIGSAGRPAGNGLGALFLLIALVVFALVGLLASRHNGLLRSGVWAGFLAALITAFIAVCLGVVILILLAPYALLAGRAATHPGARAALGRLVVARATLGVVGLLLAGLIGGAVGGVVGRLVHPRGGGSDGGSGMRGAPYVADPAAPTRQYTAPPQPLSPTPSAPGYTASYGEAYAASYPPTPPINTPPVYYPPATPLAADAATSPTDGQS
jgi:hypothetical protein